MDGFSADWISFVIIGLGTLFLFGELMVNMKGFFGLLGFGFITLYFLSSVDPSMVILMMVIYLLGLLLIVLDGKVINDGTLAVVGIALMFVSVALSSANWVAGLYAVLGILIGGLSSLLFLKVFKHRKMWTKVTLIDKLTEDKGYSTMNAAYKGLVGREAVTMTAMRPVGVIKMDNKEYSAVTNGQWIEKDTAVTIVQVDGTRILIAKLEENEG